MPQALIAAAQWVGTAVFTTFVDAVGVETAATIANAAFAATLVAEVAAAAAVAVALQPKIGGDFGTQVDFKADPRAGIPYVVGRTGVAGNIVFTDTAGNKNSYLNHVVVLSGCGPIDSIESFKANDTVVNFTTDAGEGAAGFYQNKMWLKSQLGATPEAGYLHFTATGTKDTPADHNGMPAAWSATHKLSGYAAFLWGLDFAADRYGGGAPKPLVTGKFVKIYDPRLDSTYPGGSGTCRALNEATYVWSENGPLHALTWALGRYQNGKRVAGGGIPIGWIDVPAFVEAANVADANAWKCGGQVYTTDDKYEVFKAFLQSAGCKPMRLGAKLSCVVNTPRVSLTTLTAADVVGDVEIAGTTSRRARLNTIWPEYRDENQGWQVVTADAPVSVAGYVAADGQIRSTKISYVLVQSAAQAAQLASYDISDGREFTPVTLPCNPRWLGYGPGDCITADEPEWGLTGQKLLILQTKLDPLTMTQNLVCRSETDGKHPLALGQTGTAPSTPGLAVVDANAIAAPGAGIYTAAGVSLTGGAGVSVPAIEVSAGVNAPDNGNAAFLLIRYRKNGTTAWSYWQATSIGAADKVDLTGLASNTAYDVQVAYRSMRGAESGWTDLGGPFTAGALTIPTRVFDNARPGSPLEGDINVIRDGNGRVTGIETYHSGAWVAGATSNKVTASVGAPATPTVNDIWVQLDGAGNVLGISTWTGAAWTATATRNTITSSVGAPANPINGDTWVVLDGNGRVIAVKTRVAGAWVQSATNNNIAYQTSAPTTPTINDIWVDTTDASRPVVKIWTGSAWAASSIPAAIVQYLNPTTGRMTTINALPGYNVAVGAGLMFSVFPFTSDTTNIYVATATASWESGTRSLPSATLTGLSAGSIYGIVFLWSAPDGTAFWAPIDPLSETLYVTSPDGWLFAGEFSTQVSGGGGTYPAPNIPPGYLGPTGGRYDYNQP